MNAIHRISIESDHKLGSVRASSSWYAVQTFPRYEKKVDAELRRKGVETFLPLFTEKHQWSDRQRRVDLPLFPNYVFIRLPAGASTRVPVLRTTGVTGFAGARGMGTPIPDAEITAVRNVLHNRVPFRSSEQLKVGQKVRVRGGSLNGVEGVLVEVKGEQSLLISIVLIQRALSISIEGYFVEPV